jgi:hypothetical protein
VTGDLFLKTEFFIRVVDGIVDRQVFGKLPAGYARGSVGVVVFGRWDA